MTWYCIDLILQYSYLRLGIGLSIFSTLDCTLNNYNSSLLSLFSPLESIYFFTDHLLVTLDLPLGVFSDRKLILNIIKGNKFSSR